MRKAKFLCFLLFVSSLAFGQQRTITGKVTDPQSTPLAGVTVTEKNTNNLTTTGTDGTYQISVQGKNPVLVFSFIGFATAELTASANTLDASLKLENRALQEVYVVAYGNQTKKNITSAISVVNSDQIRRQQVVTATQALQGLAPGVLVVNNSGQPGDNPQIRIRGIASVNASAEPLIVVDGIPFNGNINLINPNDIENFTVLKDASATALYGSRAANGVILVNTKTGRKNQKPRIALSSSFGTSQRALPEYPFANGQQLMELNWEALKNLYEDAGNVANPALTASADLIPELLYYNPYIDPEPVGTDGKLKSGLNPAWSTDWANELTRTNANRTDVNLGVSGGSSNNTYYFGLGYLGQEGYLVTSQFKRVNTRFNFNSDVNRWLTLGFRSQYVYSDQNYPNQAGTSFDNVVQYIRQMSPLFPVYQRADDGSLILDADGNPIWDFGNPDQSRSYNQNRQVLQPSNLLATTYLNTERRQRHMTTLNGSAEVKLLPSLRYRTNFGLDRYEFISMSYENPDYGNGVNVGGRIQRAVQGTTSWTWNHMLTYKKTFGDHNLEVMGSAEWYRYQFTDQTGQKTGFPFSGLTEFNTAANTESLTGYTDNLAILSFLGRLKYDFRGKYFIEGTIRRDGSSRFAEDYRWGYFPAIGASWLISEEGFMAGIKPITLLKLRGSYGRVGNEALASYFPYLNTFGTGYDELDQPGVYFNQLGNAQISWEKQGNLDIGLDFGLFDNRLNGSIDYFKKDAIDLLFSRPLVMSGGIPSVDFNIGDLTNSGWEINLNGIVLKGKKYSLEVGANATFIHNEFKKLPQEKLLANPYQREVGKSIYEFFIAEWAGVDPDDGAGMWYADELDNNGNPTGKRITTKEYASATRYYQGSAIPKVSGGFNTRFNYGGFDLSILFNYAIGGKYLDENYQSLVSAISASAGNTLHTDVLNRWQKAGDVTDIPRLDLNNTDYAQVSTRYLFDGDYARLRNITIGYNIVPKMKGNLIQAIRLYGQADNIWTISGLKKGADPESDVNGQTGTTSSVFKTFSAGIEITF